MEDVFNKIKNEYDENEKVTLIKATRGSDNSDWEVVAKVYDNYRIIYEEPLAKKDKRIQIEIDYVYKKVEKRSKIRKAKAIFSDSNEVRIKD